MENVITATEAVKRFSAILNRIKFTGNQYVIKRSGKPVAYMGPIKEPRSTRPLKELKFVLKELPRLGHEIEAFASDLEGLREHSPSLPVEAPWE